MRDIVLALALVEGHEVHPGLADEAFDVAYEPLGDRVHERGGGEAIAEVVPEEAHHADLVLELGNVEVQVHPIDALDLQGDVVGEHLGHTAG